MHNVGLRCFKAHVENEVRLVLEHLWMSRLNFLVKINVRVSLSKAHKEIDDDNLEGEK